MNAKQCKEKISRLMTLLQLALKLLREENIYSRIERIEKINFLKGSIEREIDEEKPS